jgi:iron-sulfur cluster repair protein YtfE (RIC family)
MLHSIGPDTVSFQTIVEDIISSHHSLLRRELPQITNLIDALSAEYPDNDPLTEAKQIYARVRTKVEAHLKDEETILFPTGVALESGCAVIPTEMDLLERLAEMEKEHDGCGNALTGVQKTIVDLVPQCKLRETLIEKLQLVQDDFVVHVEKENTKVHPMFIALFSPTQLRC